jgi:tetrahydromethanopterin S-methyltransferase subunit B
MKATQSTLIWQFVSSKVIRIIKVVLYVSCDPCIIHLVPRVTLCVLTSLLNDDILPDLMSVFHYAAKFKFIVVEMSVSYYDPQLLVLPSIPGRVTAAYTVPCLKGFSILVAKF